MTDLHLVDAVYGEVVRAGLLVVGPLLQLVGGAAVRGPQLDSSLVALAQPTEAVARVSPALLGLSYDSAHLLHDLRLARLLQGLSSSLQLLHVQLAGRKVGIQTLKKKRYC